MRIYEPLEADHPMVTEPMICPECHTRFLAGDLTVLLPIETPEEAGSLTVRAVPLHAECALAMKASK